MLQIADLRELEASDIEKLLEKVKPILAKRQKLHEKYSRSADASKVMFSDDEETTVVPFEKFITDLATGYLSGKPTYQVSDTDDKEKADILAQIFDKEQKAEDYKKQMEVIIDYISSYNDDETENHDMIHDILEMTSAYQVVYESEDNEIIYSRYDPLQTVATWDYNIPPNLTGLIRTWEEKDKNDKVVTKVELTDYRGTRTFDYSDNNKEVEESDNRNHEWGDVPCIAVETDFAIFESAEDVIEAYEQLVQNTRNTYQYNDSDCKLQITGYTPENPMTIVDEEGNIKENPERVKEDQYWVNAKTIYCQDGGSVGWLMKPVDSSGVTAILKLYVDLMFQLSGIPNTSDLAFNSADLNASAIDRKFYIMNMATRNITEQLKKAYLRRWELIFNRINLKKNTKFDFRDIEIDLPKNLPTNNDEMADSILKLRDIISNQTLIEKLGYNWLDEKAKKDEEKAEALQQFMEQQQQMKVLNDEQGSDDQQALAEDGRNSEALPTDDSEVNA